VTLLLAVAVLTTAVDGVTKRLATLYLLDGRLYALAPGWGVRLVNNRRASLSVRETAVLLAVITGAVIASGPEASTAIGLGMAIGGAAGNLLDRIRRGAVIDFVAAGRWPVFNLGDAAMTIGLLVAAVSVL
jgi:signal peptidase II